MEKKLTAAARRATDWIGSVQSLVAHTLFFIGAFCLEFAGFSMSQILLVLTTAVSLEAIYLAIFIQMALNEANRSIDAIEEDIDEIQEDIDEIQEDVDEIQEEETEEQARDRQNKQVLDKIEASLGSLIGEIEKMKKDLK